MRLGLGYRLASGASVSRRDFPEPAFVRSSEDLTPSVNFFLCNRLFTKLMYSKLGRVLPQTNCRRTTGSHAPPTRVL
ncbi:hypothetical protein RvY_17116 [Ramazzottius varieornatus]|uniref:Uncharacterized protein n=1 Tax=Ramazzottius varieornatus TaxID=947166 RepID=A0A1D1W103_RAMVA|nr:hypothetical protein RvY_17116 [Ramazzottius varieornatus]